MSEPEPETEVEITDLDPQPQSRRPVNRRGGGQRLSARSRLWMTLFTLLGVALLAWLVASPWHLTGASPPEQASQDRTITPSHQAPSRPVQILVVQHVTYLLDQGGLVSALWIRHKYMYLLWQQHVAPSSKLLRVEDNVVYLAAPDASIVALRASDGTVLWIKKC